LILLRHFDLLALPISRRSLDLFRFPRSPASFFSLAFLVKMSSNPSSQDAQRDVQESGHRVSETIESGLNAAKRAVFGGSETGDKMSETAHQGKNRASETGVRLSDKLNQAATDIKPDTKSEK